MTFSKFLINIDDFIESKDDNKSGKIIKLNLPSEQNFYDRQYIMFDNMQQDRIIYRLEQFILFNKFINEQIKKGVNLLNIFSPTNLDIMEVLAR